MKRVRVGINGFGRMGRLAFRAARSHPGLEVVAVNDPGAGAETMALLLEFDSVQGRWDVPCCAPDPGTIDVGGRRVAFSGSPDPATIAWPQPGPEIILECSGRFRTIEAMTPHLDRGARRVVVSAPVRKGAPNVVMGVNHDTFDPAREPIVSAASCTTNCLAPVVRVLHDAIGIARGLVTTIHAPTNTQSVQDAPHKDPRRARAASLSLIPTSTNSATAVTLIIPELAGRLDSIAVRAPVLNASLTDAVFAMERRTTVEEVNAALETASRSAPLHGILGYEPRPLVSADYAGDPRSAIVDARSTRVTDGSLVKVLAWYDNEWGYANRLVELTGLVAGALHG